MADRYRRSRNLMQERRRRALGMKQLASSTEKSRHQRHVVAFYYFLIDDILKSHYHARHASSHGRGAGLTETDMKSRGHGFMMVAPRGSGHISPARDALTSRQSARFLAVDFVMISCFILTHALAPRSIFRLPHIDDVIGALRFDAPISTLAFQYFLSNRRFQCRLLRQPVR